VDGAWQESILDKGALSVPSSGPTSSNQGNVGSDFGGSDRRECPSLNSLVPVVLPGGRVVERRARSLRAGDMLLSPEGVAIVTHVRRTGARRGVRMRSRRGRVLVASPSHPVLRHGLDRRGTMLCALRPGDRFWAYDVARDKFLTDHVQSIEETAPRQFVAVTLGAGRRTYVADGVACHNLKPRQDLGL
jgi:hypothetical protein